MSLPQYTDKKQPLIDSDSDVDGGHDHKRRGTFINTLIVLLIVLVALGTLAGKAAIRHHQHHSPAHTLPHEDHRLPHNNTLPLEAGLPPDITLASCANWSFPAPPLPPHHPPRAPSLQEFTLPLTAPALEVLAHGCSAGRFRLVQDARAGAAGVRVEVRAAHRGGRAAEHVKVCAFTRAGAGAGAEGHGVVILGPKYRPERSRIDFQITMHLPRPSAPVDTVHIRRLETRLQRFAHAVGHIGASLEFGEVALSSWGSPVAAEFLSAATVVVNAASAAIEGNFSARERLELITGSGRISANILLANDPAKGPTALLMRTVHAPVDATITLTSPPHAAGRFSVDASTYFAPLALAFPASSPSAPFPPSLRLMAHTAYAPISVALPPAYTGAFSAATGDPARGALLVAAGADARTVAFARDARGGVAGRVWVEGEGEGEGDVRVSTTLARVVLRIRGAEEGGRGWMGAAGRVWSFWGRVFLLGQ